MPPRGLTRGEFLSLSAAFAFGSILGAPAAAAAKARQERGAARLEITFRLPGLTGNPFDFTANDVRCAFRAPDGKTVEALAFFDGGDTWRVRLRPGAAGRYELARVTRNGAEVTPEGLSERSYTVERPAAPGFVRRDPQDATRFRFDNGEPYYPLGHNVAWASRGVDVAPIFDKMEKVGENWSRVWMNHWDNKNLDWVMNKKLELGTLDLEVARRWDAIVEAAERNGIYFQMVLQHHGQYSSTVNPNWGENPWNRALGGFLEKPEDFFTDARAKALTKAKYRYIIARWGYSPSVMAWELYNEVQFTDAGRQRRFDVIAAWHKEMAEFIRAQDTYDHLVTTSSETDMPGLFDAMDFVQPHVYAPDVVIATQAADPAKWNKPIFFGEIGGSGDLHGDDGRVLHAILWSSLMSNASGAAQYWTWDNIEPRNLYHHFRSASEYLKASQMPRRMGKDLRAVRPVAETAARGTVSLGPGLGWAKSEQTEFTVSPSGTVEGIEKMSSYLQGNANRAMFPAATFHVDYKEDGLFRVQVGQSARAGAKVVLRVDGKTVAEQEFPAAERDTRQTATLEAKISRGKHVVRIENEGADWAVINRITLSPYGPAYQALGKANKDAAFLWVYRASAGGEGEAASPAPGTNGTVTIPGLSPGRYRVVWWDTEAGKPIPVERGKDVVTVVAGRSSLRLSLPKGIAADAAAYVVREGRAQATP